MAQPLRSRIYRFGVYEVDVRPGELRKHGIKQKIQGQPFEVLVALLERPNEVVTREELRARLWPQDTFVDFDHSLNTAINKVRDVLGDTASNPRFLETLPKRGYRFIAPVQAEDGDEAHSGAWDIAKSDARELPPGAPVAELPTMPATDEHELPRVNRTVGRSLFALIQVMYLIFYLVGLWKHDNLIGYWFYGGVPVVASAVIVTAVVGIPLRLYLLTGVAFDYRKLGGSFHRLWPAVFFVDLLWALSPFLLLKQIGLGLAFGACAALLYVPFSQRSLIRMTYQ